MKNLASIIHHTEVWGQGNRNNKVKKDTKSDLLTLYLIFRNPECLGTKFKCIACSKTSVIVLIDLQ